jgi:hypothetical protein
VKQRKPEQTRGVAATWTLTRRLGGGWREFLLNKVEKMDDYVRDLLAAYPAYRFANAERGHCRDCKKPIGLADSDCTGWHPTFKCSCGYETTHPAAASWEKCIHCERPSVMNILDAEVIE